MMQYFVRRKWDALLVLHIMATLAIPFILATLLGCVKKEDLKEDDGPSYSVQQMSDAFDSVMTSKSLGTANVDDYAIYENSLAQFTAPAEVTGFRRLTLLSKVTDQDLFEVQIRKTEYDSKGNVTSEPGETCLTEKTGPGHNCTFVRYDSLYSNVSYHKLVVTSDVVDVPSAIAQKPNCSGIENCKFKVKRIEYDMIFTDEDGQRQRQHDSIDFVQEPNYLGFMLKKCSSFLYKYQERYIPVTACQSLIDYANH